MHDPLDARRVYERLCGLVGKRVEIVTLHGRWCGWLRKLPEASHGIGTSQGARVSVGVFTLWGVRDDTPNDEVPFRVFSLSEVLGLREMT